MSRALDNSLDGSNRMPECAEKLLSQLIRKMASISSFCSLLPTHFIDLKLTFEQIEVYLHNEHPDLPIAQLKGALDKQDLEASLHEAECLLSQIRTLNIGKLLALNTQNEQILNRFHNQNVYLLLQTDDSPKPSLFDVLVQSEARTSQDLSLKQAKVAQFEEPMDPELPQQSQKMSFCQIPGLFGSPEPEVQIAAFLAFQKVVAISSGINAFIVLDDQVPIEELFDSLFCLVPRTESIENFSFISCTQFKNYKKLLNELKAKVPHEQKAAFYEQLGEIISSKTIFISELANESREAILKRIQRDSFIEHPSRAFSFSLDEKWLDLVAKQVDQHLNQIENGLKRNDLVFCAFKVNELFELRRLFMSNQQIQEKIFAFQPKIMAVIDSKCKESMSIWKKLDENGLIKEKDVKELVESRKLGKETERIMQILFEGVHISTEVTRILNEKLDFLTQREHICRKLSSTGSELEHLRILLDNLKVLKEADELKDLNVELKYDQTCEEIQLEMEKMFESSKSKMRSFDSELVASELDRFDALNRLFPTHLSQMDQSYSSRLEELFKQSLEQKQKETVKLLNRDLSLSQNDLDRLDQTDSLFSHILSNHRLAKRDRFDELKKIYATFIQSLRNYSCLIESEMRQDLGSFNLSSAKLLFEQLHSLKTKNTNFVHALHDDYARCLLMMTNFVHELKKKIIDQIKCVFGNQQELTKSSTCSNFAHFELRQSLDLFMELTWLDAFKTNMFTIAKRRIEDCLDYHLDEAIENLFELKVDDRNSQNILQASRMLLEINKKAQFLTHFEHFKAKIKKSEEFLAKINANLRLVYGKVFLPIKDTNNNCQGSLFLNMFRTPTENSFQIDQSLVCTQIDYEAVEQCLVYLKACEAIEMCDRNAVEKQLVDRFFQRQTAIVQLLDKCFGLICAKVDESLRSKVEPIDEAVNLINRYMPELELIKKKLSDTLSCLKKDTISTSQWKNQFKSRIYELDNEMDNHSKLSENYQLVKALIRLDCSLLLNGQHDLNCLTLAMKYTAHIKELNTKLNEKASQLIRDHAYEELAHELRKHQDTLFAKTVSVIRFKLKYALEDILGDYSHLKVRHMDKLDLNDLKWLQERIVRVRTAKQHLVEHIDASLMDNLDKQEQQVLNQLEKNVDEFKTSIRQSIESLEILKAEEKLIGLKRSIFYFDLLEMEISDDLDEEHSFEEIIEHRFNRLEIERFWVESPRNIYDQLLKSKTLSNALRMKFLQIVLDKYKREQQSLTGSPLTQVWSLVSKGRGDKRKLIEAIKRSVFYLPDDLRNKVEESVLRDLPKTFEEFEQDSPEKRGSYLPLETIRSTFDAHIASQPVQLLIPLFFISIAILRFLFAVLFSS